jgi:hypothetical protein
MQGVYEVNKPSTAYCRRIRESISFSQVLVNPLPCLGTSALISFSTRRHWRTLPAVPRTSSADCFNASKTLKVNVPCGLLASCHIRLSNGECSYVLCLHVSLFWTNLFNVCTVTLLLKLLLRQLLKLSFKLLWSVTIYLMWHLIKLYVFFF